MTLCPKCIEYFTPNSQLCPEHQKEYETWLTQVYTPQEKCNCGSTEWMESTMQMTDPPSFPEKEVYRCRDCNEVRIMTSESGTVRIMERG